MLVPGSMALIMGGGHQHSVKGSGSGDGAAVIVVLVVGGAVVVHCWGVVVRPSLAVMLVVGGAVVVHCWGVHHMVGHHWHCRVAAGHGAVVIAMMVVVLANIVVLVLSAEGTVEGRLHLPVSRITCAHSSVTWFLFSSEMKILRTHAPLWIHRIHHDTPRDTHLIQLQIGIAHNNHMHRKVYAFLYEVSAQTAFFASESGMDDLDRSSGFLECLWDACNIIVHVCATWVLVSRWSSQGMCLGG